MNKNREQRNDIVESKLSQAGAEIANASEINSKIETLNQKQESELIQAQKDVAEAYELMDET